MSPVRVTFRRTVRLARSMYTTALSVAVFLAATSVLLAFHLDAAEGCRVHFAPLWAISVAPVLPVLAAVLGMDVWSDERKTGRIDLLLSSPVRERDFVLGKFLGVWAMTMFDVLLSLLVTVAAVGWFAPTLMQEVSLVAFLPGLFALALQGALWCAVAVAASAFFRQGAAAACTTIALLVGVPRGLWYALMSWSPAGRPSYGENPLDAQAFDLASGLVSTAAVITYVLLAVVALFIASKAIASLRCDSRGATKVRYSTRLSVWLSILFAVLAISLAYRLDMTLDVPIGRQRTHFSARTLNVLSESHGVVTVTVFVERKDPRFRELGQFLRALSSEAEAQSGMRIEVRYVDPVLDVGVAQRLKRDLARKFGEDESERGSLVFEYGGHIVGRIRLADGYGERACVSLLERIAVPFQRSCVYWTTGHGEASFSDDSLDGLSAIRHELELAGYENRTIDLSTPDPVPDNCALLVIAGARNDFATVEMGRLRAYLEGRGGKNEGGRLLVLIDSVSAGGLQTLLSEWGIRPVSVDLKGERTFSASDVVVTDFALDHVVSEPFGTHGQKLVLDRPVAFEQSAAADEVGTGADRKHYKELLRAGGACLAASVESGGVSPDLAIRPTRVIAIGDLGFVLNGQMMKYSNANRDFFLNAVKYLSGRDALTESGEDADLLVSGMDRVIRARFVVVTVIVVPFAIFVLLALGVARRRRR